MDNISQKSCTKCRELKNIDEFYKDKKRKDGHSCECKKCVQKRGKEYSLKNGDKIREKAKAYYYTHLEVMREKSKKWFSANPEKRSYYKDGAREKEKARHKKTRLERRLKALEHYGGKCAFCGDRNINHLSLDHIHGNGNKHRKEMKGASIYRWVEINNYPEGFQILCHNHNLEKGFYGTMTPAEFENE